jgi:hypothetical protein
MGMINPVFPGVLSIAVAMVMALCVRRLAASDGDGESA